MFSRTEERLALFFLLLGLGLRAALLVVRGENYEVDQAVILYWGRQYWESGTPAIFGPEFTHWEMLTSYFYGGLDLLGLNPQWGAFALSAVEVLLTGVLVTRLRGRGAGLVAMALLAVFPWHVFYSSIVGTCVAVGIWPLLLVTFTPPAPIGVGVRALGLWHYTAFRVFLAAEVLWAALRRRWRAVAAGVAGFTVFFALVMVLQPELWRRAFFRGEYVFETPEYAAGEAVLRGLLFLITPMKLVLARVADMEVGSALHDYLSGWDVPVTWPGALLLALGCARIARGWARESETFKFLSFYALFTLVTVSFAASFTHLLFLAPVLVILMARGFEEAPRPARAGLLLIALSVMAGVSFGMIPHFREAQPRDPFSHRIAVYAKILETADPGHGERRKFLLSSQGLVEARYWMARTKAFLPLAPSSDTHGVERQMTMATGARAEQWILIDRFVDPELDPVLFPAIAEQNRQVEDMIAHVKKYAQVLEERNIDDGVARAVLMKIRWP